MIAPLAALLLVVVLGTIDSLRFEWVALGAALLVTAGGCLSKDEIYGAVEWRIIVMILGTLGLGLAMDRTGRRGLDLSRGQVGGRRPQCLGNPGEDQ